MNQSLEGVFQNKNLHSMAENQIGGAQTGGLERRNVMLDIVLMILAWFTILSLIL